MVLAASRLSVGTIVRVVTDCAGAKKLDNVLRMAKITQIWPTSVTKTSMVMSTARMMSLAIITRFTFQWSTNTPAMGLMTASGNTYEMVTAVTRTHATCSVKVIRLMTPKRARKSPKMLTNWASQSVRNGLC